MKMTNQEILTKATQKAINGGWRGDLLGNTKWQVHDRGKLFIFTNGDEEWSLQEIIFNHAFAQALWGYKPYRSAEWHGQHGDEDSLRSFGGYSNWQFHLQQMVVDKDPVKYLGDHI